MLDWEWVCLYASMITETTSGSPPIHIPSVYMGACFTIFGMRILGGGLPDNEKDMTARFHVI